MSSNHLEDRAVEILERLVNTAEDCSPITRELKNLTASASLYAIRHQALGLLYIGKTRYTRERFRGGHKAFLWAWLDHYSALRT